MSNRWDVWFADTCVSCCKLVMCQQIGVRSSEVIADESFTITSVVSLCAKCAPKAYMYSFSKCDQCGQYRLGEQTNKDDGVICEACKSRGRTQNISPDRSAGQRPASPPMVG